MTCASVPARCPSTAHQCSTTCSSTSTTIRPFPRCPILRPSFEVTKHGNRALMPEVRRARRTSTWRFERVNEAASASRGQRSARLIVDVPSSRRHASKPEGGTLPLAPRAVDDFQIHKESCRVFVLFDSTSCVSCCLRAARGRTTHRAANCLHRATSQRGRQLIGIPTIVVTRSLRRRSEELNGRPPPALFGKSRRLGGTDAERSR